MFITIRTYSQVRIACFDMYSKAPVGQFEIYIPNGADSNILKANSNEIWIDEQYRGKEALLRHPKYLEKWLTIPKGKAELTIALIPSITDLQGVVFTDVHRRKTHFNTTVLNVHKITNEKIKELGANTVRDALVYEPNIRITRDNAIGSSGLEMMGIGGDNVKIMIDGVPIIGRFFNQLDLEQFNVENIEQIEIIKGPMSIIYGSNALAGSINIVTKQSNKSFGSISQNYSSEGLFNTTGTAFIKNNKHGISLSAGRLLFDGWRMNNEQRAFSWIPKEQYNVNAIYSYKTDKALIRFKSEFLHAYLMTWGNPMRPYGESAIDIDFNNIRLDNSLTYERKLKKGNVQLMAGNNHFIRHKNTFLNNRVTGERILVPRFEDQDTQTFNASIFRLVYGRNFKDIETVVGFDGNYEIGRGGRITNGAQDMLDAAIFTSAEKKLWNRFLTRVGLRYGYNSSFSLPLLYSLQTKWNLANSQVIKAAYGRGFRAPSLKELYLEFVDNNHAVMGNDNLKPESSHSISFSYTNYYGKDKWKFSTTIDVFYNDISNKIDFIYYSATEAEYGNIARFQSTGGEITQTIGYKNWNCNVTYVHLLISNALEGQSGEFFSTPQLVLHPSWKHEESNTSVNLFYNFYGRMNRAFLDGSDNISIGVMQSYTLMDATVSKLFFNKKLSLTVGVRNILNWMNIENTIGGAGHGSSGGLIISPGRTFFINARYEIF